MTKTLQVALPAAWAAAIITQNSNQFMHTLAFDVRLRLGDGSVQVTLSNAFRLLVKFGAEGHSVSSRRTSHAHLPWCM